jgi:hypothetical protein
MSIAVMTSVWERSEARGSALLLLLAIADSANDEGVAWPSQTTLAKKIRMSRRSVQVLLNKLIRLGEIHIVEWQKRGRTHVYKVTIEPAQGLRTTSAEAAQVVRTDDCAAGAQESLHTNHKESSRTAKSDGGGVLAYAPPPSLFPVSDCVACGEMRPLRRRGRSLLQVVLQ